MGQPKQVLAYAVAASLLVLSTASFLEAQQKGRPPRVVEAQEFRITGAGGKILASLHAEGGAPTFSLFDSEGVPKVTLTVATDGAAAVRVGDPKGQGKPRTMMLAAPNGLAGIYAVSGDGGTVIIDSKPGRSPNIVVSDKPQHVLFQAVR
jgi:hypothetical protein